jgi:hypothetical protein
MRLASSLMLLTVVSFETFSQDTDTCQPDSIYRINKVLSRLQQDAAANPWEILINYDSIGRRETVTLMKDKKDLQKIIYRYDSTGKMIAEEYHYGPRKKPGEPTQTETTSFTYDSKNRIISTSTKRVNGKTKNEVVISYDPHTVHIKDFYPGGKLRSETDQYYEKPNITKRFAGIDYTEGGKEDRTWDYSYKNVFDKSGRLARRETREGKNVTEVMIYEYDANSLLIQKTAISDLHPPIIENFVYTYYE